MSQETLAAIASETLATAPTQRPTAIEIVASYSPKVFLTNAGLTKIQMDKVSKLIIVKQSKGGGLFLTFLNPNPNLPKEERSTSIWFSDAAVTNKLVAKDEIVGDGFFARFQFCDMLYTMPDGTIETRTKICGLGESNYADVNDSMF